MSAPKSKSKAKSKAPTKAKTKIKSTAKARKAPVLTIDVAVAAPWKARLPTAQTICRRAAAGAYEAVVGGKKPKGNAELAIVLTSDAAIRRLNKLYRGKDKATDVLSFPAWSAVDVSEGEAILGDVVVAYATATRDAKAEDKRIAHHLTHLVVHGVLHLLGYDHERDNDARVMERLEVSVLKSLGIADPYKGR